MKIEKKLENIIWHIETNRKILGDERILDDVLESLKNLDNLIIPERTKNHEKK